MPKAKKSRKNKLEYFSDAGKFGAWNLRESLHPYLSWCVLGLVAACSLNFAGNALAALSQAADNYNHQAFRLPIAHVPGRYSSSTAVFMRQRLPANGRQPAGTPDYASSSRRQISAPQFQAMKKNLNQFSQLVASLRTQVASLQKQNIGFPSDLTKSLTALNGAIGLIKDASSSSQISGMSEGLSAAMQTLGRWTPKFFQLAQLPKMIQQGQVQLNQAIKTYGADQKRAANSRFDLSAPLADYKTSIDLMQSALDREKTILKNHPENATTSWQTDFFNNQDNLQNKKITLDIALNPKQGLNEAAQIISQDGRQIKSLKNKGVDTTKLDSEITQAATQIKQVKSDLAATSTDASTVLKEIEGLMSILQSISNDLPAQKAFIADKSGTNFQPPPGFAPDQFQPPTTAGNPSVVPSTDSGQNPPPDQNYTTSSPTANQAVPPPPPPAPPSLQ